MTNQFAQNSISRRSFLRATTAFAIVGGLHVKAQPPVPQHGRVLAYIGTYSHAPDGGGNGDGIELFELNSVTGELLHGSLAAKTPNPSWIVIHPSKKYLYAINEVADFDGANGSVSAFAIDGVTGGLRALNTVSSEGAGPAYLSLDLAGKFAFVANYGGGSIAVLPIAADGSLDAAVDVHRDLGAVGSARATDAPPGSFAISGHDAPHAHMIAPDPRNRFVLATDLGQDRIYAYRFDRGTGKLTAPRGEPFISLPSGDGPRHFAYHPNGHWLYSIQEESTTIAFFHYDAATGSLDAQQTVSALPPGFAGTNFASEILVAPDGKTLYAANRLHDTIAMFAIGANGSLRYLAEASTLGDYPRECCIDPSGNFLFVCNQRSDSITSFRIHRGTGLLEFTGHYTPVGSPACITFLA
jgi:6-phosphogluconolactonase